MPSSGAEAWSEEGGPIGRSVRELPVGLRNVKFSVVGSDERRKVVCSPSEVVRIKTTSPSGSTMEVRSATPPSDVWKVNPGEPSGEIVGRSVAAVPSGEMN